ncbi:hypothetical protein [Curtobacterium pusillum]|uniref:DUF3558 domain-containing protein n=1 Tax=Curtobacterium pusillum TaxID=69373 RepID=A0ABX2MB16_9MICO|nr:hypothetical protein [Curtobacterium pusillum]NUU14668.1 hypothetical protein [Curtobacterium pusillum]
MRTRTAFSAAAFALVGALTVSGCSSARDLAGGLLHDDGGESRPCPSDDAEPGSTTVTPSAPAMLDPAVAREVRAALRAVRKLPGVQTATESTTNTPSTVPDATCASRLVTTNHFRSTFEVDMEPSATPSQAGAVPTAMAGELAWTGVDLTLTVPAGSGHIASVVHYDATFDQTIPPETSTAVAQGLATLAATPHVTGLEATIPTTMRVDYGSLVIGVDRDDQSVLDAVHAVIDTTAFRATTLHGSFGNGAKP